MIDAKHISTVLMCVLMITSLGAPVVAGGAGDSTTSDSIEGVESLASITDDDSETITVGGTLTQHDGDFAANDTVKLLNFDTDEVSVTETLPDGSFSFEDVEADAPHALHYYQGEWQANETVTPQEPLPRDGVPHFAALGSFEATDTDVTVDETLPEAHNLTAQTVDADGDPVSASVGIGHSAALDDHLELSHTRGYSTGDDGHVYLPNQDEPGLELGGDVTVEQAGERQAEFSPIETDESVMFEPSEVGLTAQPTEATTGEEIRFETAIDQNVIGFDEEITGGDIQYGDGNATEFTADQLEEIGSLFHAYDEPGVYTPEFSVSTQDADDNFTTYTASAEVEVEDGDEDEAGSGGGGDGADGSTDQQLLFDRDDVEVWERAPLPFRADVSGATETIAFAGNTQLFIEPEFLTTPIDKEAVGIFDTESTIPLEMNPREGANTNEFADTDAQLVIEEVDADVDTPAGYEVINEIDGEQLQIDENGELSVDLDGIESPGQYLIHVVAVDEQEDRFELTDDGLVSDGTPQIVGMDHLAVQAAAGEIDGPDQVARGDSFEVDVEAPIDADGEIDHTLIAYDRSTVEAQAVTINLFTDDLDELDEDAVEIEHDIAAVNGVADVDENLSMFDRAGTLQGTFTAGSVLDVVADQTAFDRIQNESTDDLVLDASMTSLGDAGTTGTLTIETLPSWSEGDYELLYLAQQGDDTRTLSTATDSVEVFDEELDAALTIDAEDTEVPAEVTLDAGESAGAIVDYQWDLTGDGEIDRVTEEARIEHTYDEPGEYEPAVTITNPDGDEDTASGDLSIVDTTPPDVFLAGPEEVDVGEEFDITAEAEDNHRIDELTLTVTDDEGTVVENVTTDEPFLNLPTSLDTEGTYTATATAVDPSGNEQTETIEVEAFDLPNLETTIDAASEQRLEDGVNATVTIDNVGSQPTEEDVAVALDATGVPFAENDSVTFTDDRNVGELGPDENTTFDVDLTDWAQDDRIVGDIDLTAEADPENRIEETTTDTNVATETIDVTYVNLEAEASARDSIEGRDTTLRSFISNEGTATSADNRTAAVTVTKEGETEPATEYTVPLSELEPGDQTRNQTTAAFEDSGTYEMEVKIGDEDHFPEGNLANTTFQVEPYSLAFDADRTRVPSEVERGDDFSVAFRYETNSRAPVNASLDLPDELEFADESEKQLDPRRDRVNTVRWDLVANETSQEDLELNATIEDTLDLDVANTTSATTSVPVRTERFTDRNSTVLQGAVPDAGQEGETEANSTIEIRNETTYEQELTISVQGDSEGRTLQGLEYLVRYPYGCVEQTTSAFLGALNTKQYYEDRDYEIDDDRFDRINGSIEQGVDSLAGDGVRGQQDDGSWNMWGSQFRSGETFFTSYALFGLSNVEQDPDYSAANADRLDDVDFDRSVAWLNQDDQNEDGSFDARWYIRDQNAMTGFAMLTVDETLEHDRSTEVAEENATELYLEAADYLVEEQTENGAWEARSGESATSTALSIWGLQTALDNLEESDFDEMNTDEAEIETAIADGHQWLIDDQGEDGAWSNYQSSPFWNTQGDASEEAAFSALALDATNETAANDDTEDTINSATRFLTSVYEDEGSWGYPRATTLAIDALQELTDEVEADREVTVTIGGEDGIEHTFDRINEDNPDESIVFDMDELEDLRDGDTIKTVEVDTDDDSGLIIVAIENDQTIDRDEFEGGD